MTSISLPRTRGAYALELYLPQQIEITIGRLGKYSFRKGIYIYLGSASGPGGINARLGRHITGRPFRRHWHIGYLRNHAQPTAYSFISPISNEQSGKPIECCWSQALTSLSSMDMVVPGFGVSDCLSRCKAHLLFYLRPGPESSILNPGVLMQDPVLSTLAVAINVPGNRLVENTCLVKK